MMSVGEVQSEVVVEGEERKPGRGAAVDKEELRDVVREIVEELLESYLRHEERRG